MQQLLRSVNVFSDNGFHLVDDSHAAISAANMVLLASGTATLEAMLLRRPMVVVYRLAAMTYWLASRMVKIPYVALPNLLVGKQLVPEYIQDEVRVPALRDEIVRYFSQPEAEQMYLQQFDEIHKSLRRNASVTAAAAISELVAADTD